MKRQKITPGSIFKINLEDGSYSYGRILNKGYAFYDIKTEEEIEDLKYIVSKPILFIVAVYNDVINSGRWEKIGKLPLENELLKLPLKYIQDARNPSEFNIYDPNTGIIRPATKDECRGLEVAAVWEAEHVEERLMDHFSGRPNMFILTVKISFEKELGKDYFAQVEDAIELGFIPESERENFIKQYKKWRKIKD